MPHSQYEARREPPGFFDRVLIHPFTVFISLASLVMGVAVLATVFSGGEVSRALSEMPIITQVSVAVPLIAGPPIVITGALNLGQRMSRLTAMAVERVGCILIAAGWLGYCLAVFASSNPFAILSLATTIGVGNGFAARALALWLTERRVRRVMEIGDAATEGR